MNLDSANVIAIIIGAIVSLATGLSTFWITRTQTRNEQRRIIIEEKRSESDDRLIETNAAATIVGGATSVVSMYQSAAEKAEGMIVRLESELAEYRIIKNDYNVMRARLGDLLSMIKCLDTDSNGDCDKIDVKHLIDFASRIETAHNLGEQVINE